MLRILRRQFSEQHEKHFVLIFLSQEFRKTLGEHALQIVSNKSSGVLYKQLFQSAHITVMYEVKKTVYINLFPPFSKVTLL
jgi:hypothetical protein